MATRKKAEPVVTPTTGFEKFAPLNVPINPLRTELASLQTEGFEVVPLDTLLEMIHRIMRAAKNA